MIEKLYEQVLLEESIKDWIMQNKNVLKAMAKELTITGLPLVSAASMGIYVSNFLTKNFPNLPEQALDKIAQFISNNPIKKQFVVLFVVLICSLFIGSGFVLGIQSLDPNSFSLNDMNFFDALYFMIITCTTIGYGDIYPTNSYSRIFIVIMLFTLFIIITNQITVFCRHAILRIQGMASQPGQIGAAIRFNASRQIKQ